MPPARRLHSQRTVQPGAAASQLFSRVQVIGSRGVGVGQLNKPRSVAVDAQDNLYVVDMTGRVQKFSSNGVFLLSWQMPQTDLGKPKGMGRDRRRQHHRGWSRTISASTIFSPEGKLVAQWGERGTNAGQFMLPRAVAVNSHGEIFVSEYGVVERVQRFAAARPSKLAGRFRPAGQRAGRIQSAGRPVRGCAGPALCGRFLQSSHPDLFAATANSFAPTARPARAWAN